MNKDNSTDNLEKQDKEFYDRVYLCTQNISKIDCKRFDTFKEADAHRNSTYKNRQTNESSYIFPVYGIVSTLIPMCKYTPEFLDKPILKYKLKKMVKVSLSKPE